MHMTAVELASIDSVEYLKPEMLFVRFPYFGDKDTDAKTNFCPKDEVNGCNPGYKFVEEIEGEKLEEPICLPCTTPTYPDFQQLVCDLVAPPGHMFVEGSLTWAMEPGISEFI